MGVCSSLATWAIDLRFEDIPGQVRDQAIKYLVDAFGNAMAAARLGAANPEVEVAKGLAGNSEATVIGSSERISSFSSALANGALVHSLDFDDTHPVGLVHASSITLPTAFAIGEEYGSTGSEVITAAVAGYEIICRLGIAAPQSFHERGAHATSICGAVASAIIAAKIAGLDEELAESAMGIAASQSSGLLEFSQSGGSVKGLHPGWAAGSGIIAARLAKAGLTGPCEALEGEFGLYSVFAGRKPDLSELLDGLGTTWRLMGITVKLYPSCQLMHPSLNAARRMNAAGIAADDIRELVVAVPSTTASIVCEPRLLKLNPTSPYEAKFSLPWSVAAMLIDGEVTLSTYSFTQLDRADIAELASRIFHEVVEFDGPDALAPGSIRVLKTDGSRESVLFDENENDSDDHLTCDGLVRKLQSNTGSRDLSSSLIREMGNLGDAPNVRSVMQLISFSGGATSE